MKYKFVLRRDRFFSLSSYLAPSSLGKEYEYIDVQEWKCKKGVTRLTFDPVSLGFTVKAGYAWDGCSPKIIIPNLITIGTPDGVPTGVENQPQAFRASLIHDALYQFRNSKSVAGHPLPGDRLIYDQLFRDLLKEDRFMFSDFYYCVVRTFGNVYAVLTEIFK